MRLDEDRFAEAVRLALAHPVNSLVYSDDATADRAREGLLRIGVPPELADFLRRWALASWLLIGVVYFNGIESILEDNEGELGCIDRGFLGIGSAADGSWLVVDARTGATGFLPLSRLCDIDLSKSFRRAAASVGEYFLRHARDPEWASDAFEI